MTSYDELPYDQGAFWTVHPDRLAAAGRLHGLTPRDVRSCRVLELGCGCGSNLLPMAAYLGGSRFTGIDLSPRQIEMGTRWARELALANLRLECRDILDFHAEDGSFDYILCHGVYSWVPREVREAILKVCCRCLAEHGVALISHNVLPGWHLNRITRDAMAFGARGAQAPAEQASRGLSFLDFLARYSLLSEAPYGLQVKEAAEYLKKQQIGYTYHEYLEAENFPQHIEEFIAEAEGVGLRYLCDGELVDAVVQLPQEARESLAALDLPRREQAMDFLCGRAFRHSLLCRSNHPSAGPARAEHLRDLHLRCACNLQSHSESGETVVTLPGGRVTVTHAPLRKALAALESVLPGTMTGQELLAAAGSQPPGADDELTDALLWAVRVRLVHLLSAPLPASVAVGPRPAAWPLVRWQAMRSEQAVNVFHRTVQLDATARSLLPMLDGKLDRLQIGQVLRRLWGEGKLVLPEGLSLDVPDADLLPIVDTILEGLARACLLVPCGSAANTG